jgi:1-aminocyclopropane-1-carboxylate deaminase
MLLQLAQLAPVQELPIPEWEHRGVAVSLWRLDLMDSAAPGNKIFKLEQNLRAARDAGCARVLSFGGAFSNHLHALALAGATQGFKTVGIVRGEPTAATNPTLSDCAAAGMQLRFVDRAMYRILSRVAHGAALPAELREQFGDCYVIPEGGANRLGALGCKALGEALLSSERHWDAVVLPCATGTTLAGLAAGLKNAYQVLGIAVLKGADAMADDVRAALAQIDARQCDNWVIDHEHHGGGYARMPADLSHFIDYFQRCCGVPVEPVYSGKMLYAIHRRIERGDFARGTRLLAVHTGGLQGARGFSY